MMYVGVSAVTDKYTHTHKLTVPYPSRMRRGLIMIRIILQYDESMHGFSIGEAILIYTLYS